MENIKEHHCFFRPHTVSQTMENPKVAAIFGVTGLIGRQLAKTLLINNNTWKVYGIARSQGSLDFNYESYHFVPCDLLSQSDTRKKLSQLSDVTHLFWMSWASQYPEHTQECCDQNKAMLCHVLDVILPLATSLRHVSIQTGVGHYVALPWSVDGSVVNEERGKSICIYDEDSPRVSGCIKKFYYVLEDLVKEKLAAVGTTRYGNVIGWSIIRPAMIIGSSEKSWFNVMGMVCVYATISKELNLPFVFGGTKECWEEMMIDLSDARLVAEQHIWAALMNGGNGSTSTEGGRGEAFNALNGTYYRWKEIWPVIGREFGIEDNNIRFSEEFRYEEAMADKGEVWKKIVKKEGLIEMEMERLDNWKALDFLFRSPMRMLCSREKSDRLGFLKRYQADESAVYWIDIMRKEKLIPN